MVIVLMEDFGSLILVFGTAYQLDQCLGRARSFRVEHFRTYWLILRSKEARDMGAMQKKIIKFLSNGEEKVW